MSIDTSPALAVDPDEAHTAEPVAVELGDDAPLVADELLVEEISIDGMCGVY